MLFYQVGEAFQEYAVARSRKSITALLDIRPDFAHLIVDDEERKVDPSLVHVGDMILVKAGERIPLDGVITEGHAMLDTAALTGESLPRSVGAGDQVLSGCINMDGSLKVRVEKGLWRIYGDEDSGNGGKRIRKEIQDGEIHHTLCKSLYTHCGSAGGSGCGSAAIGRAWEILPVVWQSIGILSCFLSLCIGIVCAADVFCGDWRGIQVRDSGKGRRRFGYAEPTENGCF